MEQPQIKSMQPNRAEAAFNIGYMVLALGFGVYFFATAEGGFRLYWAILCFVLVIGDAFHLIPRIAAAFSNNMERYFYAMGRGKQVTSITMSLFYLVLWQIGAQVMIVSSYMTVTMVLLFAARVVLCILPQNGWTEASPSYNFSILRNIPLLLQGILIVWMFASAPLRQTIGLQYAWLAVMLSFEFYLIVVLFAHKKPMLGMLMLPKTLAYLWLLSMGFSF